MKKVFLSGLIIFLPAVITIFILFFTVDFITAPFVGVAKILITKYGARELEGYHYHLLLFACRVMVLVFVFLFVLILGACGRKIFFSWLVNLMQYLFCKIPIIKTVYKITQEVCTTIFDKRDTKLFRGSVLVPFPHEKAKALAFLSTSFPVEVAGQKTHLQAVFVPTSPHPISGFLVLYNQEEIQHVDINTEDLLKVLLSCGIYNKDRSSGS